MLTNCKLEKSFRKILDKLQTICYNIIVKDKDIKNINPTTTTQKRKEVFKMMYNKKHEEMKEQAIADIIETLENGFDGYYCDLHNEVFNTDYYIIGIDRAKKVLTEYDVFKALDKIQDYEKEQFGEIFTDLSDPEKVVNMLYYIIGDEVISEMYDIEAFCDGWNDEADEETNKKIIEAMKEKYNC